MYVSINDTLFDDIRLDILVWTNHEMQLQKMGTINEYIKQMNIFVFVKKSPDSYKPYYTFKYNNTYFTVYAVKLGETFVQMNPFFSRL